jgi:carbamoylphosphate synthase large subunit
VVRPSYVLGGRAMEIVHEPRDLERYMREAVKVSNDSPVLLDRFLNDAIECDVDALRRQSRVHRRRDGAHRTGGVHSGDSACSLPPYSLSQATVDELKRQTAAMAKALNVVGLMNVQFAIQQRNGEDIVYVLEVNPRVAYRAVRVEGHRPVAGQDRRALHGRPVAGFARYRRRGGAAVLQRQGSRVPVQQVPGRGSGPRT